MNVFYGCHISINESLVKVPREHKREQVVVGSHHGGEKQR